MATKTTTKPEAVTTAEAPKAKRTMLTPAEKIAKLEADLAAAKAKAEAKENKARDAAWAQRDALLNQVNERLAKIHAIEDEFGKPADTDPANETGTDEDTES